jgi:hypothetical protein
MKIQWINFLDDNIRYYYNQLFAFDHFLYEVSEV